MNYARKHIFLSIFTLLIILALSTIAFGEETIKGVVIANDVNVREKADIDSTVVSVLKLGEYVTITDSSDEWYSIQLKDGQTGWVYNDLVVPVNPETDLIKRGIVNADNLNVREQPDMNGKVLVKLQKGLEITIAEESEDWYKITTPDNMKGWVHSDYITIKANYSTGLITGNSVNVRSTPSLTSEIVIKLDHENYVAIKDFRDGWYNIITADDVEGWIYQDYISIVLGDSNQSEVSRSSSRAASLLKIVDYAKKYLGKPYKWAASGPNSFDCSGFTYYIYKQFGIKLPRQSNEQSKIGEKIAKDNLTMGDLVFFDTSGVNDGKITHVGIYIGDGEFIHASSGSNAKKVTISRLDEGYYQSKYVTARRVF